MESDQFCNVYHLITRLCEKIVISNDGKPSSKYLRKLRTKAYEILLSKYIPHTGGKEILENNKDPLCHVLAWEFLLINKYNLPDHAKRIQKCVENLQKSVSLEDDTFRGILCVLLKLTEPPDFVKGSSTQSVASMDSCIKYRTFDDSSFYLNVPKICSESKYKNTSFQMKPTPKTTAVRSLLYDCKQCLHTPSQTSCSSTSTRGSGSIKGDPLNERKELYDITTGKDQEPDIWELASTSVFTQRRTWETLGNPCPTSEVPFLTESPSGVCTNFYDLLKWQRKFPTTGFKVSQTETMPMGTFIKHVKFLLVGMTSDSFKSNANNELYLVEGIGIEGISQGALQKYAKDLLLCGSYYKALNNLCNTGLQCYGKQHKGFIFKEFCDCINRYLSFYRVATLSLSESSGLLKVHHHIKPLHEQLECLASICKVGPYAKSLELPSGVALLNYLYDKLISLTRNDIVMILYSILYPCIQVYFSRFLQQWVFEGIINDPYNEFFIHNTQKFMKARSRSYWTKCYITQVDIIPDFLTELAEDILYCGKAMNLLKLCSPSSPLCLYIMGKKPSLISCKLNPEQTNILEQESMSYYLEALAECGPKFSIENILNTKRENRLIIMDLATKKRAATIKRLEMEKVKKANKDYEEKQEIIRKLKADYDKALQDKKSAIINDVLQELKRNESMLKIHDLRKRIIEEEALKLIEYYDTLMESSECKRLSIEKHICRLKKLDVQLETVYDPEQKPKQIASSSKFYSTTELNKVPILQQGSLDSGSESSFHSATSESTTLKQEDIFPFIKPSEQLSNCVCLDIINANTSSENSDANSNGNVENTTDNKATFLTRMVLENKEAALRNRQKIMSVEMGILNKMDPNENENSHGEPKIVEQKKLSELQKNRLRVMSSEFNLDLRIADLKKRSDDAIARSAQLNSTNNVEKIVANENYLNENVIENNNTNIINSIIGDGSNCSSNTIITHSNDNIINNNNNNDNDTHCKNKYNLTLDIPKLPMNEVSNTSIFSRFWKSPNFELGKPVPMSIDSTPCTGYSNTLLDKDLSYTQSLSTAVSYASEDVLSFPKETLSTKSFYHIGSESNISSKTLPLPDAKIVSTDCLKLFIQQSVLIPVNIQTNLVNNQLLKYFFVELEYLFHLNSLRNYFFLLDGEFGRNITEGLFERLYDVNFPIDLINFRTLQNLVYNALDSSIKSQKDFGCLSFKINSLPKTFDLGNPDVLDCLSLTYKVHWPLNILLPSDIISKYDEVFKFVLKLSRVSWVLKKIFQDLKLLSKESGSRECFIILSAEYKRIHFYRHIMTHFIQTFQNYIVGEVLQPSWNIFEKNLMSANCLNDLYNLHNAYVKDILFKCLLNKRFAPIRNMIQNTFVVILKFHHYLSANEWMFDEEEGLFTHPNFQKLENIFLNFQEFVIYVFKAGRKVAKVGYQPHLVQLLDMLDVNGYYSKNITEST